MNLFQILIINYIKFHQNMQVYSIGYREREKPIVFNLYIVYNEFIQNVKDNGSWIFKFLKALWHSNKAVVAIEGKAYYNRILTEVYLEPSRKSTTELFC